jgi:hypothetical protein
MSNPEKLPVPAERRREPRFFDFSTAGNQTKSHMSILSGSVFVLDLLLLFAGNYLFAFGHDAHNKDLRDPNIPALYFLSSLGLMLLYAWLFGNYVRNKSEQSSDFSPGPVSARWVMGVIALLTSLSFMAASYEILSLGWWKDRLDGLLCLAAVPGTCLLFAWIYSQYGNGSNDMLPAGSHRHTWGRTTIITLIFLSFVCSIYYVGVQLPRGDWVTTWVAMVYGLMSVGFCLMIYGIFTGNVSKDKDRGVPAS